MTRILSAAIAAAALAVAGCGSDNNNSASTTPPPAPAATTPVTSTPSTSTASGSKSATSTSGEVEVKMQNIQFAPNNVTVKVGQRVKWENEDTVDHNVTATDGADFKSDNFGKGKDYEFTPTKAGTIKYTCTIHPGMDGVLNVTK